jgi:parallel beta-helix repeat protein
VSSNSVRNCGTSGGAAGIFLDRGSRNKIIGNSVVGCSDEGLLVVKRTDNFSNQLIGNSAYQCNMNGLADGGMYTVIQGNSLIENSKVGAGSRYGMFLQGTGTMASGNYVSDLLGSPLQSGVLVTADAVNVRLRDTVVNGSNAGAWINNSGTGTELAGNADWVSGQHAPCRMYLGHLMTLSSGSGSPEGVVTASVGSLYVRSDGSTNTTLYVKTSGATASGWTAK